MGHNRTDDLISIFYDGEGSPEEQSEAESQLETSDQAKRELTEMQKLTKLLQMLPRESVPEEFCIEVMQAVERESSITRGDRSLRSAVADRRTVWQFTIGTVIVTAAAMFVMVKAFQDTDHQGGFELAGIQPSPATRMSADEPVESASMGEEAAIVVRTEVESSLAEGVVADSATVSKVELNRPKVSENVVAQPLVDVEELSAAVASRELHRAEHSFVFDNSRISESQVGEMIEALDTSGERIAVVRLTVVDRLEGLENLQFLLTRNQIAPQSIAIQEKDDRTLGPTQQVDRLMAVYVETNTEQLASALRQFNKDQFRKLKVEKPIAIGNLDDESKAQIGYYSTLSGATISHQEVGSDTSKVSFFGKNDSDQKLVVGRSDMNKPSMTDSQEQMTQTLINGRDSDVLHTYQNEPVGSSAPSALGRSRQIALSLSANIFERLPKKSASGTKLNRSQSDDLKKNVTVDTLKVDGKIKGKAVTSYRHLKVLFVLVANRGK